MAGTYQFGAASYFDAISEINKKGIQFIGSRYVYFKTTADRTQIGGSCYIAGTLDVTGDCANGAGGSWDTLSDIRIKDIKGDFTDSLSKLKMELYKTCSYKDHLNSNKIFEEYLKFCIDCLESRKNHQ